MTETQDLRFDRRTEPHHHSDSLSCPKYSQSRPGNKRIRMSSYSDVTIMPQSGCLTHPVKDINRLSKLMMEGDYNTPIRSLTKTLKTIKLILSGDAKVSMPTEPESRNEHIKTGEMIDIDQKDGETKVLIPKAAFEFDFSYPSRVESSFLRTSVAVEQGGGSQPSIQELTVSVFRNPMIVKGDCFDVPLDARLCEELSCVAIYNLALSHQLKAMSIMAKASEPKHLSKSKAYLCKALSLYEYSHQIFKNQIVPVRTPALLCMALVSNLGQIHQLLGDITKADQCNKYLLSVLMYAIDSERVRNAECPQNFRDLIDGFLVIVQHLIFSEDVTASAA